MEAQALEEINQALATVPRVGEWVTEAACRGQADLFTSYPATLDAARRIAWACDACPVRLDCFDYAHRNGVDGIWAGEWHGRTANIVTVKRRAPRVVCGTLGGYKRHRRLGEDTCQPCRDANAAAAREQKARAAA